MKLAAPGARIWRRTAIVALMTLGPALTADAQTREWSFDGVEEIELHGVSGDLQVEAARGDQIVLLLDSNVEPRDRLRADVDQDGSRLLIEERWRGGRSRGSVDWTLQLPKSTDPISLRFETASGDLTLRDVAVKVRYDAASGTLDIFNTQLADGSRFDTASGDLRVSRGALPEDCRFNTASGDVELDGVTLGDGCRFSTASGDVEARDCSGYFDLQSASGDINLRDCQIDSRGQFSVASGDVRLELEKLPAEGLMASSASGDVTLTVDEFGENFELVLIKREDKGRFKCPFPFTDQGTFRDHHVYERKTVKRGSGQPEIELSTASGSVTVR